MLSIKFKKVYDSIIRKRLYQAVATIGITNKIIHVVKMTLNKTKNEVSIKGSQSEEYETKKGLKQGNPVFIVLFNFLLKAVFRRRGIQIQGTINKLQ